MAAPVALVLAGTRGLGAAAAASLADAGHPVAICGRSQESVDKALAGYAGTAPTFGAAADVSREGDLTELVHAVTAELGPPSIVVANAGGPPTGGLFDTSPDDWTHAFHLTLLSVVTVVRLTVPAMRQQGFGRIVVIGSSSVRRPIPGLVLSNVFRPALNGLVKDLAVELAQDGVTVNLVSPGRIDTERVADLDARQATATGDTVEGVRARSIAQIPAGRYGRAEEIGAIVAFLASASAGYITGQSILVDGGLVPALP